MTPPEHEDAVPKINIELGHFDESPFLDLDVDEDYSGAKGLIDTCP